MGVSEKSQVLSRAMASLTGQTDLDIIGVDESYQGQGVGKKLMEWGIKHADENQVEIFLYGTEITRNFYQQVRSISNLANRFYKSLRSGQAIWLQDCR